MNYLQKNYYGFHLNFNIEFIRATLIKISLYRYKTNF